VADLVIQAPNSQLFNKDSISGQLERRIKQDALLGLPLDVVLVSRPPDADEQRYFRGM
jgi:hypothetical protein